jgi:hypothetical protein
VWGVWGGMRPGVAGGAEARVAARHANRARRGGRGADCGRRFVRQVGVPTETLLRVSTLLGEGHGVWCANAKPQPWARLLGFCGTGRGSAIAVSPL